MTTRLLNNRPEHFCDDIQWYSQMETLNGSVLLQVWFGDTRDVLLKTSAGHFFISSGSAWKGSWLVLSVHLRMLALSSSRYTPDTKFSQVTSQWADLVWTEKFWQKFHSYLHRIFMESMKIGLLNFQLNLDRILILVHFYPFLKLPQAIEGLLTRRPRFGRSTATITSDNPGYKKKSWENHKYRSKVRKQRIF